VPGQLDTVIVDAYETVEVYTELDNPGVWMAHCHILEHADLGMMTELHVE
jgi:suppressor of ftsI